MQKILLSTLFALSLVSCEQQNKPNNPSVNQEDYDNTGRNIRDRDSTAKTPMSQSEGNEDLAITQRIRRSIMSDDSLSTDAKNIKIITIRGVVTLRGPVASAQEKDIITKKVNNVQGVVNVDNQLEVTRRK